MSFTGTTPAVATKGVKRFGGLATPPGREPPARPGSNLVENMSRDAERTLQISRFESLADRFDALAAQCLQTGAEVKDPQIRDEAWNAVVAAHKRHLLPTIPGLALLDQRGRNSIATSAVLMACLDERSQQRTAASSAEELPYPCRGKLVPWKPRP